MSETTVIPLFPLELVLFPQEPLPLYIFEPRYKDMVDFCVEQKVDFGVILAQEGKLSSVGTTAHVENILKVFPDGRKNILCMGKQRFEIHQLLDRKPYLEAEVVYLNDQKEKEDLLCGLRTRGEELLSRYSQLICKPLESHWYQEASHEDFSYVLSELCQYNLREQQRLLELRSTVLRLKRTLQSLECRVQQQELEAVLCEELGPGDYHNLLN